MDSTVLIAPLRVVSTQPSEACANCEAPRMGEYCYACGQHFLEGRLTIRGLVRDYVVRKLGLEGGLLRTVVDLTVRPASMIRHYLDGRRQRYTNPVGYLLLTAGAYALLSRAWAGAMAAGMRSEYAGWEEAESFVQVQLYAERHPALSTVILCLFLVPALRLLFRKTTTVAEASVFSIFILAHLLLMQIVITLGAIVLSADVYRVSTGWATGMPMLVLLFSAGRLFGGRFSGFLRMTAALALCLAGGFILMALAAAVVSVTAAPAASV